MRENRVLMCFFFGLCCASMNPMMHCEFGFPRDFKNVHYHYQDCVWARLSSNRKDRKENGDMKAVQFDTHGGPDVLRVRKCIPKPSPGERDLLIRVKAAGVNPIDTYIRASSEVNLPHTPGFDCAGVVDRVGPGVEGFAPGDRVFTLKSVTGTYAEFATAHVDYVGHLDDALSFEEGACIGIPYFTAYKALFLLARAQPGETVLIHGASGGVGMAASQLAASKGLNVFGTAGTKAGMDFATGNGCKGVCNHKGKGYVDELLSSTGGNGFDVIIEMAAHVNLVKDAELMSKNGRTIIVGSSGEVKFDPGSTMAKEICFRGISILRSSAKDLAEIRAGIEEGQRSGCVRPKLHTSFPMERACEAHRAFGSRKGAHGKIVITM